MKVIMSNVSTRIIEIVHNISGVKKEDIHIDSNLYDLGMDSLDISELVLDLEKEFEFQIDDWESAKTIKDIENIVIEHI